LGHDFFGKERIHREMK